MLPSSKPHATTPLPEPAQANEPTDAGSTTVCSAKKSNNNLTRELLPQMKKWKNRKNETSALSKAPAAAWSLHGCARPRI